MLSLLHCVLLSRVVSVHKPALSLSCVRISINVSHSAFIYIVKFVIEFIGVVTEELRLSLIVHRRLPWRLLLNMLLVCLLRSSTLSSLLLRVGLSRQVNL